MPSQAEHTAWLASLSPWPQEFGLGRMRTLLAALGDPQLAYPAIHVVGTNGKSTATRTIEALLLAEGLSVGATVSPHVRSWAERITVDGEEADFEAAIERVRPEAEAQEATQFETLCAAAFAEFAAREVDVAVVEAGLGGRLDATNVLRSHVVLLTNVGLEHTDVLGDTREQIAAEKLAVVQEGTIAVLPDEEFAHLAGPNVVVGGAREAAAAFLGRSRRARGRGRRFPAGSSGAATRSGTAPTTPTAPAGSSPGSTATTTRSSRRSCATRTRPRCSRRSRRRGDDFVATESPNDRALPAAELARPRLAPLPGGRDRARSRRRARTRARAPARPRHRLAVPSCGFGEERGVI